MYHPQPLFIFFSYLMLKMENFQKSRKNAKACSAMLPSVEVTSTVRKDGRRRGKMKCYFCPKMFSSQSMTRHLKGIHKKSAAECKKYTILFRNRKRKIETSSGDKRSKYFMCPPLPGSS